MKTRTQPSPPPLVEMQRWLRWAITEPRGVSAALPARLLKWIANTPSFSRRARLDIYAEAYFFRLWESLSKDFEASARILGEDLFQKICAEYLKKHPSTFPNIGDVGCHLPRFIQDHPICHEFPFLADLLTLEWALIHAFYSLDLLSLDLKRLQDLPIAAWAQAKLALDPSITLLQTNWPIDDLWRARSLLEKDLPIPTQKTTRRTLIIYRNLSRDVKLEKIDPVQFRILKWIQQGKDLGTICEGLQKTLEKRNLPIMDWFGKWVKNGIIQNISTS